MPNKSKPKKRSVNAKGRNKGGGQFLPIPHTMAHSDAFRSLSGGAPKVWIELRSRYNGRNNGRVSLSYQDAADLLHMSKSTVKRAFDELIEKGFIKLRRPGQWYGRRAAEYILTDVTFDGHNATRDWQRWRPKKQKSVRHGHAERDCVPVEYREAGLACHGGTRGPQLKVIDGSA